MIYNRNNKVFIPPNDSNPRCLYVNFSSYWMKWMHSGIENNDVRSLLGAFKNDKILGVTFAIFAKKAIRVQRCLKRSIKWK